jgi:hypothetical protein
MSAFILQMFWQEIIFQAWMYQAVTPDKEEMGIQIVSKSFSEAAALVERARWLRLCMLGIRYDGPDRPELAIIEARMLDIADSMKYAPLPHPDLTANEAVQCEIDRWQAMFRDVHVFGGKLEEPEVENAVKILYEIAQNMEHSL